MSQIITINVTEVTYIILNIFNIFNKYKNKEVNHYIGLNTALYKVINLFICKYTCRNLIIINNNLIINLKIYVI